MTSPAELVCPTYGHMLRALSGWLAKAQDQRGEDEAQTLLCARLAPDMFPLSTQIRFACVQAREGVLRLQGAAFPASLQELLEEGRNAGDQPGSMADAQARIAETLAMLDAIDPASVDAAPDRPIAHELPTGMIFDLTALQYARDWALPQFYFHIMAAYAILRSEGVDIGKADYAAHMFGYLRPGTMPGAQ